MSSPALYLTYQKSIPARNTPPSTEHVSLKTWIRNAPWSQYFKDGCRLIVKSPFNFFVFFCCLSVVVWGAFLVLLMGNLVKLKDEPTQKLWIEIASQVLNGFFTLANVPVHPKRFLGLVRGFRIMREDKAIQQQFLYRFRTQPTNDASTTREYEQELLKRLRFYRCFPNYGRERTEACATTLPQDEYASPLLDVKGDERSRTMNRTETRVVVSRSRSRSKSRTSNINPQRKSTSVDLSRGSTNGIADSIASSIHPVVGLDDQETTQLSESPSAKTITKTPDILSPSEKTSCPSIAKLRVDIAEEDLNDLLTEATHRVVHSVVLPFLPFPLDVATQENDPTDSSSTPVLDSAEAVSKLEEGQYAAPLKTKVIQRNTSYSGLPRTSSSKRASPRTRARTMTMSIIGDTPADNVSPRRPTFVIHEGDYSSSGQSIGPELEHHNGFELVSSPSPPDLKSSKKKSPPPPIPMPEALTLEQMDWVDIHEARLLKRKERLQKSWPWYNYTIPAGIEPVDFFVSPEEHASNSSTTILLTSSPSDLTITPLRFCLIVGSFNLNSMIQEILCGFMWGMNYHVRYGWVVGTGMALGCLAAIVPSVMIMLHEQAMSRMQVVATTEETIQDVLDEKTSPRT